MSHKLIKTSGFVLKRRNQGETSKVVTLLTKDSGRLEVKANGARSTNNRFSGLLEPYYLLDIEVSSNNGYMVLRDATKIGGYGFLGNNLQILGVGSVLSEILDKAMWQEEENNNFYSLLESYLNCYEKNEFVLSNQKERQLFISSFLMSVLAVCGRLPILEVCGKCGGLCTNDVCLIVSGLCHNACLGADIESSVELGKREKYILERVVLESCDSLINLDCTLTESQNVMDACLFLYRSFFERELKTLDFMNKIFKQGRFNI